MATFKSWQNPEDFRAIEDKRRDVAGGGATIEEAHAWAKSRFDEESFFNFYAFDPAVHLLEVAWRLPAAMAWIAGGSDPNRAAIRYREFRIFGLRQEVWVSAENALRSRLLDGHLVATAIKFGGSERAAIPSYDWNDLIFRRHGAADVIVLESAPFRTRYSKVRVDAAHVRELWPEQSSAVRQAVHKQADLNACIDLLAARMGASPHQPIAKAKLKDEFPGLSKSAFERAWGKAVLRADVPVWSAPGRRRSKSPQG